MEERGGKLYGYEFKWSWNKPVAAPKNWLSTYPNAEYEVITPENYQDFILTEPASPGSEKAQHNS